MVIIFCGIPGSGKSTIAKELAEKLKKLGTCKLFVSDKVTRQVYKRISELLKKNLGKVDYIVVDATFYKRKWQEMVFEICGKDKVVVLDIQCPFKVCLQRNKKRKKPLPEKVLHIIHHQMERPKKPDLVIESEKIKPKEAASLIFNEIIKKQYLTKKGFSKFLKRFGTLYSKELGIDLNSKKSSEIFKWFLASLLFGARISETIAKNTYKTLEKYKLLTPQKVIKAGRHFLIHTIMREGGYVRYDGKTSDELLRISKYLLKNYNGNLNQVHQKAKNPRDLEKKLQEFYSVGPVTCRIFLRELRGIWKKAEPKPGKFVKIAAKKLGISSNLAGLKKYWQKNKVKNFDFRNFEVALLRLEKDYL
ncbi:AAA family ATPase [bacterium]|nr:AAA family ATPase [bacterium]